MNSFYDFEILLEEIKYSFVLGFSFLNSLLYDFQVIEQFNVIGFQELLFDQLRVLEY